MIFLRDIFLLTTLSIDGTLTAMSQMRVIFTVKRKYNNNYGKSGLTVKDSMIWKFNCYRQNVVFCYRQSTKPS